MNGSAVRKPAARQERAEGSGLFVRLHSEWVDHLNLAVTSLTELKLVILVMDESNKRQPGDPGGWTEPLMTPGLADRIYCTPQNLNDRELPRICGPDGLIERVDIKDAIGRQLVANGPKGSFVYRVRFEILAQKYREARKEQAEWKRAAREKEKPKEDGKSKRPGPLPVVRIFQEPVRMGVHGDKSKPIPLPAEAQRALVNITSIQPVSKTPGLRVNEFTINGSVLLFVVDTDPAPGIPPSPKSRRTTGEAFDNSSCQTEICENTHTPTQAVHNEELVQKIDQFLAPAFHAYLGKALDRGFTLKIAAALGEAAVFPAYCLNVQKTLNPPPRDLRSGLFLDLAKRSRAAWDAAQSRVQQKDRTARGPTMEELIAEHRRSGGGEK